MMYGHGYDLQRQHKSYAESSIFVPGGHSLHQVKNREEGSFVKSADQKLPTYFSLRNLQA